MGNMAVYGLGSPS